jgi:hypothetical protein
MAQQTPARDVEHQARLAVVKDIIGPRAMRYLLEFERKDALHTGLSPDQQLRSAGYAVWSLADLLVGADAPEEALLPFITWMRNRVRRSRRRDPRLGTPVPFDHPSGYCLTVARSLIARARKVGWLCKQEDDLEQAITQRKAEIERWAQRLTQQSDADEESGFANGFARGGDERAIYHARRREQDEAFYQAFLAVEAEACDECGEHEGNFAGRESSQEHTDTIAYQSHHMTTLTSPQSPHKPATPGISAVVAAPESTPTAEVTPQPALWEALKEHLRGQLTRGEMIAWINGAELGRAADGSWIVWSTSSGHRDQLRRRYRSLLQDGLNAMVGHPCRLVIYPKPVRHAHATGDHDGNRLHRFQKRRVDRQPIQ